MVSRWILRILSRQEVARLMLFAFAPDEDNEALAGCNDVASLKAGVVHGPLVCSFGVLLIGWRRIFRPRTRVRDELLRPAKGVLHRVVPLPHRKRRARKCPQPFPENAL